MSDIVFEKPSQLRFDSGLPEELAVNKPSVIEKKPPLISRIARGVMAGAIAIGATTALDYGLHTVDGRRAAFVYEVAKSDILDETTNIFSGTPPTGSVQSVEAMRMSDGLFKNSEFGFISSLWADSRGEEALYIESLLHPKSQFSSQYNQGLEATINNYGVEPTPGLLRLDQGVSVFHSESDAPYVDDGLWIAHDCLRKYLQTHDKQYLNKATEIFNSSITQWDNTKIQGTAMGGIYEQYQLDNAVYHYRATIANALAVSLGFELNKVTGESYFRNDSIRILEWINQNLKDKSDGLYFDRVYPNGHVVPAKYTYVQAEMAMAMYSAHADDPHLYSLSHIKDFIVKANQYFVNNQSYGKYSYFDSIWSEVICYIASQINEPSFTGYIKQVVDRVYAANQNSKNAITPLVQSPLLEQSGKLAVGALTKLPFRNWKELSLG